MAAPSLPALAFNVVTVTGASTAIYDALNAIYTALGTTTYDNGASVPAAAQWQVTRFQAAGLTEAVYCEPAASSPIAGKVVLIWAGSNVSTHVGTQMLSPDTYINNRLFFGMWVAKPGQTVARSDYNAWDNATPFNGSNGFFSGYTSFGATGATWTKMFLFSSAEYLITQYEIAAAASTAICGGGAGIRAPTTAAADSTQSDGRVYDMWTSGATAVPSNFWAVNSTITALLSYSGTASSAHSYYMAPLATAMRACQYRNNAAAYGNWPSSVNAGKALSGAIQAETITMKDVTGGATDAFNIGRHRACMFGPQQKTKEVLSTGGTNYAITVGYSSTTSGDAIYLPM